MKMRKLLPLVLLAVGSLFLLTSCDAMLDAIFASNQITVYAQVSIAHVYFASTPVTVTLYDNNSGKSYVATESWASLNLGSGIAQYNFTFISLPDHTFSITAVYPGTYGDGYSFTTTFFDPRTGAPLTSFVTMPYSNPSDSTGHSANLVTTLF